MPSTMSEGPLVRPASTRAEEEEEEEEDADMWNEEAEGWGDYVQNRLQE